MPPVDEVPRERVATAEEAEALLEPLAPQDRVPFALAFYAGLRRSEIDRLQWQDLDLDHLWLIVRKSKSHAGTNRRVPIAAPLKPILVRAAKLHGHPENGRVLGRLSLTSGRLIPRATNAWSDAIASAKKQKRTLDLEANRATRVPAHIRELPHGCRLHAPGTDGVHGP